MLFIIISLCNTTCYTTENIIILLAVTVMIMVAANY